MRTETITIYQFPELSDEAKEKAIQSLSDINVDYDWYQFIYEDAENIGIRITSFDLDRGWNITGENIEYPEDIAHLITENHGTICNTYQDAVNFLKEYQPLKEKYDHAYENDLDEWHDIEEELAELGKDFINTTLQSYLSILDKEYNYLTSEEAIIETIKANEYGFTADGNLY